MLYPLSYGRVQDKKALVYQRLPSIMGYRVASHGPRDARGTSVLNSTVARRQNHYAGNMVTERIGAPKSESDLLWDAWQERGVARRAVRNRWRMLGVVAAVASAIAAALW